MANFLMVEWINESKEDYKFITIKTIIVRVITTLSLFIFVRKSDDIIKYTLIVSMTQVLNNVFSFFYVKRKIKFNFRKLEIKKHIKPVFIIFIITNANILYTQLDKLMLGYTVGGVAVTKYVIPQTITTMIFTLLVSIIMVTIPRLSFYTNNGENEKYLELLKETSNMVLLISIPVFFGIFCISKPLIILYGGEKYMDANFVLAIYSLRTLLMVYYSILVNQIMYIQKKESILLKYLFIMGAGNLGVKIILSNFGILTPLTAILSTFVIEYILVYKIYKYIKKELNLDFNIVNKYNNRYIILAILFIPITIVINMLKLNIFLSMVITIIICSTLYFLVLVYLKDPLFDKVIKDIKSKLAGIRGMR